MFFVISTEVEVQTVDVLVTNQPLLPSACCQLHLSCLQKQFYTELAFIAVEYLSDYWQWLLKPKPLLNFCWKSPHVLWFFFCLAVTWCETRLPGNITVIRSICSHWPSPLLLVPLITHVVLFNESVLGNLLLMYDEEKNVTGDKREAAQNYWAWFTVNSFTSYWVCKL